MDNGQLPAVFGDDSSSVIKEMKLEPLPRCKGHEGISRITGRLQERQKHREYSLLVHGHT